MVTRQRAKHFYEFGAFRLDAENHRLFRDGKPVHLSPKSAEALLVLVRNAGKLLEREELMQAVWADTFVEDANLTVAISNLRKALGQNGDTAEYVETIPRVGYRFVADVRQAYEAPRPLIIEKRTQSRTVIEEEILPDHVNEVSQALTVQNASSISTARRSITRRHLLVATAATVVIAVSSFLYAGRDNRPATVTNLAAAGIRSIAVLPPQPLTNQAEDDSLSLGIADALISRLGSVQKLIVRPTSAVTRYLDTNQDSLSAGHALGVDGVLEGTMQRDHGRTRITLRLRSVASGTQLWTDNFDEADADIFKLQDSISQRVGRALFSDLSPTQEALLTRQQTTNKEAYALYLQGNYFWNRRGEEVAKSIEYLRKAIELDPNFAQAYATLAAADATAIIPSPEAEALIDKALRLDDSVAEAHATLGFIKMFHHWDWAGAEIELNRAIQLNPNSSVAHHWKGTYLSIRGRLDEAKAEMQRALELDPLSLNILADIGQLHYLAHEYDQALEYCNRVLALDPDFVVAHWYLLDIYWAKGMNEEFVNELPILEFRYGPGEPQQNIRRVFDRGGLREVISQQIAVEAKAKNPSAVNLLRLYSRLGDKEHALYWLDRLVNGEKLFLTAYIAIDPLYDPLRGDARFNAILNRMVGT